jgi:predicted ArsR family transcriptional regulator
MSGIASPTKAVILATLAAGLCGTYGAVAAATGLPPQAARCALKELQRDGRVRTREQRLRSQGRGAGLAQYEICHQPFDSLGFVLRAWR